MPNYQVIVLVCLIPNIQLLLLFPPVAYFCLNKGYIAKYSVIRNVNNRKGRHVSFRPWRIALEAISIRTFVEYYVQINYINIMC